MPPCRAMAAPEIPAIRAWLSLVGMPNHQAAVAQMTMANRAAHRAISACSLLPPKLTIFVMVMATVELTAVMIITPRKLHTAAMMMALLTPIERVPTTVAMALGASVQPLTKITPRVSSTVTASAGLAKTCCTKNPNVRSMGSSSVLSDIRGKGLR